MEMKKISFGFSKSVRKPALQAGPSAIGVREKDDGKDKIELISCVEEQSIKVVGRENGGEEKPADLVIPLREQDKTTIPGRLAKLQGIKEGQGEKSVDTEGKEETLEQKAAREIMADLKERQENFGKQDNFVVPLKPEDLPLEGARESTLDDYEAIPIESFGMAMLRGMGFKEDPAAKKKEKDDKLLPDGPVMRPKGLGLGAERAPKDASKQLIPPAKDEVLAMKNGAFVKVLTGRQKDAYGTVESLNEDTGRVMVKFAIGGNRDYVNEYLLQLVSKAEYDQYAKVLNKEKYEQYKNKTTTSDHRLQEQKEESPPRATSREDNRQQSSRSTYRDREDRDDREYRKNREDGEERKDRDSRKDRDDREYRKNREDDEERNDREDRNDRDSRKDRDDREDRDDRHRGRRDDRNRDSEDSSEDEGRHRSHHHHHHKPSRTSSGTKKKSHKYKQHRRDYSRERDSRDYGRDYRRGSSEEDEDRSRSKHAQEHKQKKTKKSKKQRSRSR